MNIFVFIAMLMMLQASATVCQEFNASRAMCNNHSFQNDVGFCAWAEAAGNNTNSCMEIKCNVMTRDVYRNFDTSGAWFNVCQQRAVFYLCVALFGFLMFVPILAMNIAHKTGLVACFIMCVWIGVGLWILLRLHDFAQPPSSAAILFALVWSESIRLTPFFFFPLFESLFFYQYEPMYWISAMIVHNANLVLRIGTSISSRGVFGAHPTSTMPYALVFTTLACSQIMFRCFRRPLWQKEFRVMNESNARVLCAEGKKSHKQWSASEHGFSEWRKLAVAIKFLETGVCILMHFVNSHTFLNSAMLFHSFLRICDVQIKLVDARQRTRSWFLLFNVSWLFLCACFSPFIPSLALALMLAVQNGWFMAHNAKHASGGQYCDCKMTSSCGSISGAPVLPPLPITATSLGNNRKTSHEGGASYQAMQDHLTS